MTNQETANELKENVGKGNRLRLNLNSQYVDRHIFAEGNGHISVNKDSIVPVDAIFVPIPVVFKYIINELEKNGQIEMQVKQGFRARVKNIFKSII